MRTPGITVRPLRLLDGGHEVNEIVFDDVEVPLAHRVYDEGKGWTVAKNLLGHERMNTARIRTSDDRCFDPRRRGMLDDRASDQPLRVRPSATRRSSRDAGAQNAASPPSADANSRIRLTTSPSPRRSAWNMGPPR